MAGVGAGMMSARHSLFAYHPDGPVVDGSALRARIEALSMFGRPEGGTFADGVSRVAYSDADVAGRRYVMDLMRAAGLTPRIDPAGNIFGLRPGSEPSLPPILFGSHIDSVPTGGNFDGDLGTLASIGVVDAFNRAGVRTRHPVEVVVWASEEGIAFNRGLAGSRIVAGDITPDHMDHVWNGMRRADATRKIGGDPDRILEARRPKSTWHAYLELHIEQGGTLEKSGTAIGVVQGIVSIARFETKITGFANHAGTTPMPERQDAMVAAAHLTLAVREAVTRKPGRQVGTVGKIDLSPNAPNVIPGAATLIIELRDLSTKTLDEIEAEIRERAATIATQTKTSIQMSTASRNPPAFADTAVQDVVERAAKTLNLSTARLPSGAGHDAQMMAQLAPMGMIFVPSVAGISHSPKELTKWDDCANGGNVLLQSVLALDNS
jgi:N-carbamoyl-L-amino-acid hydrolase